MGSIRDLVTLGKIVGGGLPVGVFGGKRKYMDMLAPLGPVYQAGTLSGNPLAMAAGMATVGYLQEHAAEVYARLEATAKAVAEGVAAEAAKAGVAMTTNRVGAMWTWFFNEGSGDELRRGGEVGYGGVREVSSGDAGPRACGCRRRSLRRRFWARRMGRWKCGLRLRRRGRRLPDCCLRLRGATADPFDFAQDYNDAVYGLQLSHPCRDENRVMDGAPAMMSIGAFENWNPR